MLIMHKDTPYGRKDEKTVEGNSSPEAWDETIKYMYGSGGSPANRGGGRGGCRTLPTQSLPVYLFNR